MHPVLVDLGPLTIYTYGFFVAMGVLSAILFARYEGKRIGIDPDRITDLCFYLVIAAIVGSRLFYVLTNLRYFTANPFEIFSIWKGGLVFYGGFIGALIVAVIFVQRYRMPLGKTADVAALAVPLGHVFGRIGCFFAGCCYGGLCEYPWAVTFRHPESLAPVNTPLHPTQLYSVAANLFMFLLLLAVRRHKRFDGQLFWVYLMIYGLVRSFIEQFRGDYRGGYFLGILSPSQTIGLTLAVVSLGVLIVQSLRTRRNHG